MNELSDYSIGTDNRFTKINHKVISLEELKESVHVAMQKGLNQMSLIIQTEETDPKTKISAFNSVVNMGRYVMTAKVIEGRTTDAEIDFSKLDYLGSGK